nr:MAG TPA: hypothetical protein [Caudoviricetes sp.]
MGQYLEASIIPIIKNPRQLCTIEPPGPDGESVCRRIIIE